MPKEYAWDKFGNTSSSFQDYSGSSRAYQGNTRFSTPAETCDGVTALFKSLFPSESRPFKVCPILADGDALSAQIFACSPAKFDCGRPDWDPSSYNDSPIYTVPACTRSLTLADIDAISPKAWLGAAGRVRFNFSENKCNCYSNDRPNKSLWPDVDSGYCYEPPRLSLSPSKGKYNRKTPDAMLRFYTAAFYAVNSKLKPADIQISVITNSGEVGKITNQFVDEEGFIGFDYTFPSFSEAKTDTIVVTCEKCADGNDRVTADISMAPTLVGFFNGILNTRKQAQAGLSALIEATNAVKGRQNLAFELFHNQTGTGGPGNSTLANALQDLAEVFDQRSKELDGVLANRWDAFWDILAGRHTSPSSGVGSLLVLLGDKGLGLAQLLDSIFSAALGNIVGSLASMLGSPPTVFDVAMHSVKLQKYADEGYPLVLVAHSQGNLFVNRAYDNLIAAKPDAAVKVLHIAPASPTLRGDYVLADIDLVINGLRLTGINSVPNANLNLPVSRQDPTGHFLVETYLDSTRRGLESLKIRIRSVVDPR